MAERAHPELSEFKDRWLGLKKNPYRRKLFERYGFCNGYIQEKVILDIPCGTGWGTSLLKGYRMAHGIDLSREAVDYAVANYQAPGRLEFQVGDMADIPLAEDSVDVVICLEGFEHVSQEVGARFIEETKRVLRRDGLFIMTCPVLNEAGEDTGNPHHVCEYPEAELVAILNDNFRIQRLDRIRGPEGPEYRAVVSNFKSARYEGNEPEA